MKSLRSKVLWVTALAAAGAWGCSDDDSPSPVDVSVEDNDSGVESSFPGDTRTSGEVDAGGGEATTSGPTTDPATTATTGDVSDASVPTEAMDADVVTDIDSSVVTTPGNTTEPPAGSIVIKTFDDEADWEGKSLHTSDFTAEHTDEIVDGVLRLTVSGPFGAAQLGYNFGLSNAPQDYTGKLLKVRARVASGFFANSSSPAGAFIVQSHSGAWSGYTNSWTNIETGDWVEYTMPMKSSIGLAYDATAVNAVGFFWNGVSSSGPGVLEVDWIAIVDDPDYSPGGSGDGDGGVSDSDAGVTLPPMIVVGFDDPDNSGFVNGVQNLDTDATTTIADGILTAEIPFSADGQRWGWAFQLPALTDYSNHELVIRARVSNFTGGLQTVAYSADDWSGYLDEWHPVTAAGTGEWVDYRLDLDKADDDFNPTQVKAFEVALNAQGTTFSGNAVLEVDSFAVVPKSPPVVDDTDGGVVTDTVTTSDTTTTTTTTTSVESDAGLEPGLTVLTDFDALDGEGHGGTSELITSSTVEGGVLKLGIAFSGSGEQAGWRLIFDPTRDYTGYEFVVRMRALSGFNMGGLQMIAWSNDSWDYSDVFINAAFVYGEWQEFRLDLDTAINPAAIKVVGFALNTQDWGYPDYDGSAEFEVDWFAVVPKAVTSTPDAGTADAG